MDFYNVESEFIDSLDYLSPPVKRLSNSKEVFGRYNTESIQLYRQFHDKCTKISAFNIRPKRPVKTGVESSTSLILKKASERQIVERCSAVSYTSLQTDTCVPKTRKLDHDSRGKPLIKVTVIPKTDQVQTTKFLNRKHRRYIPKRVQSAISNQENTVQTTNLYLVVAGRRRDKIYEIKTTGSATFSTDETDSSHFQNEALCNVKNLIQSLDMDHNHKKDKRKKKVDEPKDTGTTYNNTECVSRLKTTGTGVKQSNKSRVRIYGQLGVTEDDRYVLRYGAAVNDKSVSDFAQLPSYSPCPSPVVSTSYNVTAVHKNGGYQDAGIQADKDGKIPNIKSGHVPTFCSLNCDLSSRRSQGIQVNFSCNVRNKKSNQQCSTTDKDIQCTCSHLETEQTVMQCAKECSSPLVIISVYPKQSPDGSHGLKNSSHITRMLSPMRSYVPQAQYISRVKTDSSTEKKPASGKPRPSSRERKYFDTKESSTYKRARVRSVSPPIQNNSMFSGKDKTIETRVFTTQVEKKMPDRYKAMRVIKNKILEKEKHAPGPLKSTGPNTNQKQNNSKPSSPILQERGTNTEHAKTKKIIVDSYTKQLTDQWNMRNVIPARLDNSKVTVNIDGENEYYNLLFDQGKMTTDLRIRKTTKDMSSQKDRGKLSASLENLLVITEKEAGTQPSFLPLYNKQHDKSTANQRISGITIRDSLELCHRREDKNNVNYKNTQTSHSGYCSDDVSNDTDFSAPIKHYTGDDCSIVDPIERDKQIRELLGVNKTKLLFPKPAKAHSSKKDDFPFHCFYRRECMKSQVAGFNFVEMCKYFNASRKKTTNIAKKACDTGNSSQCCDNSSVCNCMKVVKPVDDKHRNCIENSHAQTVGAGQAHNLLNDTDQKCNDSTSPEQECIQTACMEQTFTNATSTKQKHVHPDCRQQMCLHSACIEQMRTHPTCREQYDPYTEQKYCHPICVERKCADAAITDNQYSNSTEKYIYSAYTETISPTCTEEKFIRPGSKEQNNNHFTCTEQKFVNLASMEQKYTHAGRKQTYRHPTCKERQCTYPASTDQKFPTAFRDQTLLEPTCAMVKTIHNVCSLNLLGNNPCRKSDTSCDLPPRDPVLTNQKVDNKKNDNTISYTCCDCNCLSHTTKSNKSASSSEGDDGGKLYVYKPKERQEDTRKFKRTGIQKCPLYQQLVLNRNVQVFLQIDQFSKQRPVVLTRNQYEKVKKTIKSTISKKGSIKSKKSPSCDVTFGKVRKGKTMQLCQRCDQEIQTDIVPCNKHACRRAQRYRTISKMKHHHGHRPRRRHSGDEQRYKRLIKRIDSEDEAALGSRLQLNNDGEYYLPSPVTSQLQKSFEYNGETYTGASILQKDIHPDPDDDRYDQYDQDDRDVRCMTRVPLKRNRERHRKPDPYRTERRKTRPRDRKSKQLSYDYSSLNINNHYRPHEQAKSSSKPHGEQYTANCKEEIINKEQHSRARAGHSPISYGTSTRECQILDKEPAEVPQTYKDSYRPTKDLKTEKFSEDRVRLVDQIINNVDSVSAKSLIQNKLIKRSGDLQKKNKDCTTETGDQQRANAERRTKSSERDKEIKERHRVAGEQQKTNEELEKKSREQHRPSEEHKKSTGEFQGRNKEQQRASEDYKRTNREREKVSGGRQNIVGEPKTVSKERQKESKEREKANSERQKANSEHQKQSGELQKRSREHQRVSGERRDREKVCGELQRKNRERPKENEKHQKVNDEYQTSRAELQGKTKEPQVLSGQHASIGRGRDKLHGEWRGASGECRKENRDRQKIIVERQKLNGEFQKQSEEIQIQTRKQRSISGERHRVSGENKKLGKERGKVSEERQYSNSENEFVTDRVRRRNCDKVSEKRQIVSEDHQINSGARRECESHKVSEDSRLRNIEREEPSIVCAENRRKNVECFDSTTARIERRRNNIECFKTQIISGEYRKKLIAHEGNKLERHRVSEEQIKEKVRQRICDEYKIGSSEGETVSGEITETSREQQLESQIEVKQTRDSGEEITGTDSFFQNVENKYEIEEMRNDSSNEVDGGRTKRNLEMMLMGTEWDPPVPKATSALAIHYTSVVYLKDIDISSSDVAVLSNSSLGEVHSFQTIFREHRKSPTPNLGTSLYSLYSADGFKSESTKFIMPPRNGKTNKWPSLIRLMSRLVMRSTRASAVKLPASSAQDVPSVNSTLDSYHINSSFGGVEVSSSIYDTTASFYSNHSILPIDSKMKRGFFSSVRRFLTNRKS